MKHTLTFSVTVTVDADNADALTNAEMELVTELNSAIEELSDDAESPVIVIDHDVERVTSE